MKDKNVIKYKLKHRKQITVSKSLRIPFLVPSQFNTIDIGYGDWRRQF